MAGGPYGLGLLSTRPGYYSRSSTTPTQKNKQTPWGNLGGFRSPLGLNTGTGQPTGTESPPWAKLGSWGPFWARRDIRGPQRVPQQSFPLPQQATTWGAAFPRWVSMDMTDKTGWIKILPVGMTRLKIHVSGDMARHSWPETGEPDPLEWAAAGGLESATAGGPGWATDCSGLDFRATDGGGGHEGLMASGLVAIPPYSSTE